MIGNAPNQIWRAVQGLLELGQTLDVPLAGV
jgi:hypothetical protein